MSPLQMIDGPKWESWQRRLAPIPTRRAMAAVQGQDRVVGRFSTKQGDSREFSHSVVSQNGECSYGSLITCQKKLQSDINKCLTELVEHANKTGKTAGVEERTDAGSEEEDDEGKLSRTHETVVLRQRPVCQRPSKSPFVPSSQHLLREHEAMHPKMIPPLQIKPSLIE